MRVAPVTVGNRTGTVSCGGVGSAIPDAGGGDVVVSVGGAETGGGPNAARSRESMPLAQDLTFVLVATRRIESVRQRTSITRPESTTLTSTRMVSRTVSGGSGGGAGSCTFTVSGTHAFIRESIRSAKRRTTGE